MGNVERVEFFGGELEDKGGSPGFPETFNIFNMSPKRSTLLFNKAPRIQHIQHFS